SMVMPCSRSARRPSTSSDRSGASRPRSALARCTDSSWSASTDLVSCSSRPTRVLLPSSTEPAVASRSRSVCAGSSGATRAVVSVMSEVAFPLAVLHRGFRQPVVGAGGASLRQPAGRDFSNNFVHCVRFGFHGAGAGAVADSPVADGLLHQGLALARATPRAGSQPHAVPQEHLPLVRVVDARQLDLLPLDVAPDVQLGPVRQREHPDVLIGAVPTVVEVPQLRALPARLPLAEGVAQAEDPLLGAGPLLVAAATAEHRVEAVVPDRVQQRSGLQRVAGAVRALLQATV